ncbi:LGFP repeat-containing protein [Nonomuraea polychroma]|uniref:LGFP repeat-containing protein n=1 Tax=Nonomuraea polychroma TaxID=46176 RepID=UPI003D8FCA73
MRALLAAAVTAAALVTTPAVAQAQTSAMACNPSLIPEPNSLIRRFWESKGGEDSAYGCPTSKEYGYPDKRGSWQVFEYGKVVWSPNFGEKAVIRLYRQDWGITFAWQGASRDWQRYNVMWKTSGGAWQQKSDIPRRYMRINKGYFQSDGDDNQSTRVHFKVQGCNSVGVFSGSECGVWSYPIAIDFPRS